MGMSIEQKRVAYEREVLSVAESIIEAIPTGTGYPVILSALMEVQNRVWRRWVRGQIEVESEEGNDGNIHRQ